MNDFEKRLKKQLLDNDDAFRWCIAFIDFCHFLDDVVDQDNPAGLKDETIAKVSLTFLIESSTNLFYEAHKHSLLPLIVAGFNAWLDSNVWEKEKRFGADVLKGFYHEVIYQCIFLLGGWNHLRETTLEAREYDLDLQKENKEDE